MICVYDTGVTYYLDQILDDSISKEDCLEFIRYYKVQYKYRNKILKVNWDLCSLEFLKVFIKYLIDNDTNVYERCLK